jgi:uncharacterized protein (TIGR03000 family)
MVRLPSIIRAVAVAVGLVSVAAPQSQAGGYGGYHGGGYHGGYRGYYGHPYWHGGYGYGVGIGIGINLTPGYYYGPAPYPVAYPVPVPVAVGAAPVVAPAPPSPPLPSPGVPQPETAPPPRKEADLDTAAHLTVAVPPDAQVWIESQPTMQAGAVRHFKSAPLTPGKEYSYDIRARWTDEAGPVERTRTVTIHAGEQVNVDFMPVRSTVEK